ncbi:N-acyl-D-amino-acid deacylase family protein [Emcibacter sp.]|uniref:N-acyl-D-amino-acid deacylase family protein n=1 Tax=Emcibacter sp. TaxID=1979954 RepID=UPI003A928096
MAQGYRRRPLRTFFIFITVLTLAACGKEEPAAPDYDILITGGMIYDGTGGKPYAGEVAITGDRIAYVGPDAPGTAVDVVNAKGKAVSPGFINMLSWAVDSLLIDGRGLSDLKQGVTLELFGEGRSMGPLTPEMKEAMIRRQGDLKFPVEWTTLDEYLSHMTGRGVSPNVASLIGAASVRVHELGENNVAPTPEQLKRMKQVVVRAMEDGAMGVGSSLIYAPGNFASTQELIALVGEAGRCGGIYTTHMRNEGDRIFDALEETFDIAQATGTPTEIYHLKLSGRQNWHKVDELIKRIEDARAGGLEISADMYTYPASSTGLDAYMPLWVQEGGIEKWIARLKAPKTRKKLLNDMQNPNARGENMGRRTPADKVLLVGFKNDDMKQYTGKTLADMAKLWKLTPEEAAMELVIRDGSRVQVIYFVMSEDNVKKQLAQPWVSLGSDGDAEPAEGIFLKSMTHPRSYGNFARLFAKYVREDKIMSVEEAVRRVTGQPAALLQLKDRGLLLEGYHADVVIFDPATIRDNATFEKPHQYASGVDHVFVNGVHTIRDGEHTGALAGQVVRGRGWKGWPDGGCRKKSSDWKDLP